MTTRTNCRACGAKLSRTFVDLGMTPLANSYLSAAEVAAGSERSFPLHARVCDSCFLVQVDDVVDAGDIFSAEYAYFSSYSQSWLDHARAYSDEMTKLLGLGPQSLVVEVASNDGYLLQYFVQKGIQVLGIDPAANCAEAARAKGVATEVTFFNSESARRLAARGTKADLIAANNVLAHVPDIGDFVSGFAELLKPEGTLTVEFPHLLRLVEGLQFDTIYHEHYSYLSLYAVEKVFGSKGLRVYNVERLSTHGGSLRIYACLAGAGMAERPGLLDVRAEESRAGIADPAFYSGFGPRVEAARSSFLAFLKKARAEGKRVAAYGAAAKGNTFLNYCGVGADDIAAVFDRNPHKQGRFMPGSHIPIKSDDEIAKITPDYVLVLPWNLIGEIMTQLAYVRDWGGSLVVAIPENSNTAMDFLTTRLPGVFVVRIKPQIDARGFFARTYCPEAFAEAGIAFTSTQINLSRNSKALTLRGMHYQDAPFAEAKFIRVTRGRIFDVAVDIRPESPTFGQSAGTELDAESAGGFFLPEGVAHGFLTLVPDSDVLYQMGRPYVPGRGRGFRYDDPFFKIDWPNRPTVVSERDLTYPPFEPPRI